MENYEIGGRYGIEQSDRSGNNTITPNDSLATKLENEKARDLRRDVIAREQERSVEKAGAVTLLFQDNTNNCQAWVQKQGYRVGGYGSAGRIPTNSDTPRAQGLVITRESSWGHVAIVVAVSGDYITIRESNVIKGWIDERTIEWKNNNKIKGFVD